MENWRGNLFAFYNLRSPPSAYASLRRDTLPPLAGNFYYHYPGTAEPCHPFASEGDF
ncbi:MAG: hypothetical protein LBB23_05025 [Rickettsiales bacterium]|nr:hypothetical protein [Rickettsiales bacterium]